MILRMAANSLSFHILIHDQMLKRPAWLGVFMNHDKFVTDWAFQIASHNTVKC